MSGEGNNRYHVDGHTFLEYGLPAKGAAVRVYGKAFASTETRLRDSKTDEQGYFKILETAHEKETASATDIQYDRGRRKWP